MPVNYTQERYDCRGAHAAGSKAMSAADQFKRLGNMSIGPQTDPAYAAQHYAKMIDLADEMRHHAQVAMDCAMKRTERN